MNKTSEEDAAKLSLELKESVLSLDKAVTGATEALERNAKLSLELGGSEKYKYWDVEAEDLSDAVRKATAAATKTRKTVHKCNKRLSAFKRLTEQRLEVAPPRFKTRTLSAKWKGGIVTLYDGDKALAASKHYSPSYAATSSYPVVYRVDWPLGKKPGSTVVHISYNLDKETVEVMYKSK